MVDYHKTIYIAKTFYSVVYPYLAYISIETAILFILAKTSQQHHHQNILQAIFCIHYVGKVCVNNDGKPHSLCNIYT